VGLPFVNGGISASKLDDDVIAEKKQAVEGKNVRFVEGFKEMLALVLPHGRVLPAPPPSPTTPNPFNIDFTQSLEQLTIEEIETNKPHIAFPSPLLFRLVNNRYSEAILRERKNREEELELMKKLEEAQKKAHELALEREKEEQMKEKEKEKEGEGTNINSSKTTQNTQTQERKKTMVGFSLPQQVVTKQLPMCKIQSSFFPTTIYPVLFPLPPTPHGITSSTTTVYPVLFPPLLMG
jgi:hypothetical protein